MAREEELLPLATICRRFDRLADEQREANRRQMASGKYIIIDIMDDTDGQGGPTSRYVCHGRYTCPGRFVAPPELPQEFTFCP